MSTAVTEFYGMNVPYPGFSQPSGFVTAVVLIAVLASGLYPLFKRLDWLRAQPLPSRTTLIPPTRANGQTTEPVADA